MVAVLTVGVFQQLLEQKIRPEDVDAHRGQAVSVVARDRLGPLGFLFETDHAQRVIDFHDAELPRSCFYLDVEHADRDLGIALDVAGKHLRIIHLVDMVASQNHHVSWVLFLDGIDVLIDGIGSALVPTAVDALLRRYDVDELVQVTAEKPPPTKIDVAIQAHRFELGQQQHAHQAAVQAIGQREIDDAVGAAEGDRRLGPVSSQRLEAFSAATGQDYRQGVFHVADLRFCFFWGDVGEMTDAATARYYSTR